jgi:hypothetical protein
MPAKRTTISINPTIPSAGVHLPRKMAWGSSTQLVRNPKSRIQFALMIPLLFKICLSKTTTRFHLRGAWTNPKSLVLPVEWDAVILSTMMMKTLSSRLSWFNVILVSDRLRQRCTRNTLTKTGSQSVLPWPRNEPYLTLPRWANGRCVTGLFVMTII